jgi:hypothetical protein
MGAEEAATVSKLFQILGKLLTSEGAYLNIVRVSLLRMAMRAFDQPRVSGSCAAIECALVDVSCRRSRGCDGIDEMKFLPHQTLNVNYQPGARFHVGISSLHPIWCCLKK